MLLCIIGSICFFFFFALMLLCTFMVLRCNRTFIGNDVNGVAVHLKGNRTLKNILVSPKIKMKWPTRAVSSTVIVVGRLAAMKNM